MKHKYLLLWKSVWSRIRSYEAPVIIYCRDNSSFSSANEDSVPSGTEFRSEKIPRNRLGNGFRYSAEESNHSEAFRVPRKSRFRRSERIRTEWNSAEKVSFMYIKSCLFWHYFWNIWLPRFVELVSLLRNGTAFRKIFSIFCCTERNSELCSLLRNGSNGIPRVCFSTPVTHCTKSIDPLV